MRSACKLLLVQPRCAVVRLEERGAVACFFSSDAGPLLEQRRVVQPQCARLLGVGLLLVQPRCAVVRLEERGAVGLLLFQQRCAGPAEQRRVVQPQCARLEALGFCLFSLDAPLFGLKSEEPLGFCFFSSDALGPCLSSGELFSLNALGF